MNLCIIGTGYVGVVSAACFAEMGNHVTCVDINAEVIKRLNAGSIHIFEPGLEALVKRNLHEGRLFFTTNLSEGLTNSSIAFITVGTPSREDGSCNTAFVEQVATEIGETIKEPIAVVNKSTVPVGTAFKIEKILQEKLLARGLNIEVEVVSNPEFLKEGDAVADFMKPDRVIIGTRSSSAAKLLRDLYAPFARSREKVIVMSVPSAELTKYAANCMLATKISFINEIAGLCEHLGADVRDVRLGIGADHRIGHHFIYPGLGYGGSCFPKDIKALIHMGSSIGAKTELLEAVEAVNAFQKKSMGIKIQEYFSSHGGVKGKTLAVWGLAFKANTDDVRESPALSVINDLVSQGMNIRAFDPVASVQARSALKDVSGVVIEKDPYGACEGSDALFVATEWNQFRNPNFDKLKNALKRPVVFDGRNLYSKKNMDQQGIVYFCVGLG